MARPRISWFHPRPASVLVVVVFSALATTTTFAQLDKTVYYIYQSASDVICGKSAIAIQGYVMEESFSLQRASSGSCSADTRCMLSPSSDGCLELTNNVVNTASVSVSYVEDSSSRLVECDTSNSDVGEDLCVDSILPCSQSSVFPSCSYTLLTGQGLVNDPTILSSNVDASSDENVLNTGYTIYYSDEDCTKLAALKGTVLETTDTIVGVDPSVPCDESMSCLLNPSGPSCAALAKQEGVETSYFLKYSNDTLSYCDASSSVCRPTNPNGCELSTTFPNCYERMIWGPDLLMDPETAVTPPIPVNFTTDSTYYLIYYSSLSARGCVGSAVSIAGNVIDDDWTIRKADSANCAADTSCLLDPTSTQCSSINDGLISTAQIKVSYREDGTSLILCDTSNPDADQDTCVIDPPICDDSSIYPSCTYFLVTGSELISAPNVLQNDNPPDEAADAVYIVFYNNDECTNFGAMRGVMMDTVNVFAGVADLDLYTCQDKLVCLLNPTGNACEVMKTTGLTRGYYSMSNDTSSLVYCNITDGDAIPSSDGCTPVNPDVCTPSILYPGCYYTEVWGPDLLQNPIRVITPPTDAPSSTPSTSPSEAPNSPTPPSDMSNASESPSQVPLGPSSFSVRVDRYTPLILTVLGTVLNTILTITR